MKITNQNIQDLYKFTRQHYVEHYDVQTELVDHLANDIEEIWKENPSLSFEEAREKSFKKFGIFGFMDVVEKKQSQMMKKYFKIIWQFFKEWFKLPKIILTLLLFFTLYKIQELPYAYYIYMSISVSVMLVELGKMIISRRKIAKKNRETEKRWMFEEVIQNHGVGNMALIMFYMFDFATPNNHNLMFLSEPRRVFTASMLTITIIIGYVILYIIPKKAEELLEETYPEYKIVNSL